MEVPVTLWLTETEAAALNAQARRYQQTDEQRVWAWVKESLAEAVKDWQARQWDRRKRALNTDATLAATVDAAAEEP